MEKAEDYPWSSYRGYIFDEPNDLIDFPDVYLQLSKSPEKRRQMMRAVTESKRKTKAYRSLLERRRDITEKIFYGSPKFIETMKKKHAAALEPLRKHRQEAMQKKTPSVPRKKSRTR